MRLWGGRSVAVLPAIMAVLVGCGNSDPATTQPAPTLEEYQAKMTGVLAQDGMVFVDADETCDCVVVGIETPSAKATVEEFASNAGVPAASVKAVVTAPMRAWAGLRDGIRPIKGGLQIENEDRAICTMSATVFHRGRQEKGLLTNSHCTRTPEAVDGIEFFQAGGAAFSSDFVAREVLDPPSKPSNTVGSVTTVCPIDLMCRKADAAFASFDTSTVGIVGRLARPSRTCTGDDACDWTMDSSTAELRITEFAGAPERSDTLSKIGRTTGWTEGPVLRTCTNLRQRDGINVMLYCQHIVGAAGGKGDSGAPVFRRISHDTVALAGILWGGEGRNPDPACQDLCQPHFAFSAIADVQAELGAFEAFE